MGLGTLINALGVLAGGFVGMLIGHRISKNMQEAIMKGYFGYIFRNNWCV